MAFERISGILLHPTSLPGPYGIGEIGDEAMAFLDALAESGQKLWQILPINATGNNASPYSATTTFAANPLLIDIDGLIDAKLLTKDEVAHLKALPQVKVDYDVTVPARLEVLRLAGSRLAAQADHPLAAGLTAFKAKHGAAWLDDYALFEAISVSRQRQGWMHWPDDLRRRDPAALAEARKRLADEIAAIEALQFLFDLRWQRLRAHAASKGIMIIGDMAIFVAHDSADVWARPDLFKLDADFNTRVGAGVPPDYFSATGQLWGNPIYEWDKMAEDGFSWWVARMRRLLDFADAVRIDHFRGFASCWETPAGETTAINGQWVDVPGDALFTSIMTALPDLKVIAEDLGHITEDVITLRDKFAFPGLKILEFEFGDGPPRDERHPYHYPAATVCYPSTHDNNTVIGWFKNDGREAAERANDAPREAAAALELLGGDGSNLHWSFIELAMQSGSNLAIIALQDVFGLDGNGRMNTPGTIEDNWNWRFEADDFTPAARKKLLDLAKEYGR
ncbi:MAG: 4-alpha-glucanotransferase [Aquidulcibacter sp.]|jgi:4-alpha-glucanotransferase|uniref:4-alpha-glucanotransferase n=1 Tax=Aquidulcibacter sp. TaxID=2052990 RepID=UPI0022CC0F19|nr:4-alpha-glucanotransferase [Aquidulcibacter sp.]MCE2889518.1 4-alpha-glucanotransferase [Hyphomonadaceae bacterium]MCZ8207653.1 4-alpha-glucanotransferase [Aquidulcibacter sp.]